MWIQDLASSRDKYVNFFFITKMLNISTFLLVSDQKMKRPRIKYPLLKRFVCQMWLLSSIDCLYFPLICYPIYLAVGPWSVGDVITGHTGVVFVWGIFVKNGFLPGFQTYLHGFYQLFLCQFPLIFIYASIVYNRYESLNPKSFSMVIRM